MSFTSWQKKGVFDTWHLSSAWFLRRAIKHDCLVLQITPVNQSNLLSVIKGKAWQFDARMTYCSGKTCFKELTKHDWMWVFAVAFSIVLVITIIIIKIEISYRLNFGKPSLPTLKRIIIHIKQDLVFLLDNKIGTFCSNLPREEAGVQNKVWVITAPLWKTIYCSWRALNRRKVVFAWQKTSNSWKHRKMFISYINHRKLAQPRNVRGLRFTLFWKYSRV